MSVLFRRNILLFLFTTAWIITPFILQAQVKIQCTLSDDIVEVNTPFVLIYTIYNDEVQNFQLPVISGLTIESSPGTEKSVSIINGKRSGYVRYSYTITAEKEGKYIIPPAKALYKSKTIESNSVSLTVKKQTSSQINTSGQDVFFKAVLSHEKIYLGQQVQLQYDIFTTREIINAEFEKMPFIPHVFIKPFEKQYVGRNVQLGKKKYYTQPIETFILYPQKSGSHVLEKTNIFCKYELQTGRSIFFKDVTVEKYTTNALTINVFELPNKDVPPSFSGAVGDFTFSAEVDKQTITTDDVLKIQMTIKGDGDPKYWGPPTWTAMEDVEFYEPNLISEKSYVENGREYHAKSYEYLIEVKKEKTLLLEPTFSFFDPNKEVYVVIKDKPVTVKVLPGNNVQTQALSPPETLNISNSTKDKNPKNYLTYGFSILLLIMGLSWFFWYRKRKKDEPKLRRSLFEENISKQIESRLNNARKYRENENQSLFFEELAKVFTIYFREELHLDNEKQDKQSFINSLVENKIPSQSIQDFDRIFSIIQLSLFGGQKQDMSYIYEETKELLREFERIIK
ncbi:MAG: BatD family protein [Saprospiraceae bacterium]